MSRRATLVVVVGLLAAALSACRRDVVTDPFPEAQAEVERTLRAVLAASTRKDFDTLEAAHLFGPKFTKFNLGAPLERLDGETTRRTERAGFEALEEFRAVVEGLQVDVFGEVAVATFTMPYEVVASQRHVQATARATLVFVAVDGEWKIVHEHFSPAVLAP